MAKAAKRTGSRKALTLANLAALGAERLAAILMETAEDEAGLKRRLRMELAGEVGGEDLAAELAKRLTAIEARRSRVHWRKYKAFVRELDLHRAMIVGRLAELDAKLALAFVWRFLAMAEAVFDQTHDERGEVAAVFLAAVEQLGAVLAAARPSAEAVADHLIEILTDRPHPVLGDLTEVVLPSLDAAGLAVLRARLLAAFQGKAKGNPLLRAAVRSLADAEDDIEAYAATFLESDLRQPWCGAQIGRRLVKAGRAEDALAVLARSAPGASGRTPPPGALAWEEAFLEALEADGQTALAQDLRWEAFEKRLATDRLRAFLKRLPDFDDIQAEDRALAHARRFPNFTEALAFLAGWPAIGAAAELVLARADEIDGVRFAVMEPAARLLEARHPLAASLLLRAVALTGLRGGRSERDLERLMDEIASLAVQIGDWDRFEPHEAFVQRAARLMRV